MEDGLIEIDPELYMQCRLCVNTKGKFQIPPKLQERIKYAFDIDVHLFDGFSQIMCEKCKTIVDDYCAVKENFQAKQKELLARANVHPQQENKENEEASINDSNLREISSLDERKSKKKKTKKARNKILVLSSSDEDVAQSAAIPVAADSVIPVNSPFVIEDSESEPESNFTTWKDLFKCRFICRYCDKILYNKSSMEDHIRSHENLRRKKLQLTKWHSIVQIERFDDHPNLTGNNDIIVVTPSQLIADVSNPDFYVAYSPLTLRDQVPPKHNSTDAKDESTESDDNDQTTKKRFLCEDVTTDDEEPSHRPKLRKRIRLQSTSPTDSTQMVTDISKTASVYGSDASSDNILKSVDSDAVLRCKTQKFKSLRSEYDIIKQIITASAKKKLGNTSSNKNDDRKKTPNAEDILKGKVLSIGRKVMVKDGFCSMALLSFLKQRNLNMQWTDIYENTVSGKKASVIIKTKVIEKLETNSLESFVPCIDTFNVQTETVAECKLRMDSNANETSTLKKGLSNSEKVTITGKDTPLPAIINPQVSCNATQDLLPPINIQQLYSGKIITTDKDTPLPAIIDPQVSCNVTQELLPQPLIPLEPTNTFLLPSTLPNTDLEKTSALVPVPIIGNANDTLKYNQLLKVLNVSPVANPKKAIKKKTYGTLSTQIPRNIPSVISMNGMTGNNNNAAFINVDFDDHLSANAVNSQNTTSSSTPIPPQENTYIQTDAGHSRSHLIMNSCEVSMPIITSTESWANIVNDECIKQTSENKIPRIKCKPVSELMAGNGEVPQTLINKSNYNLTQVSNGMLQIGTLNTTQVKNNQLRKIPPNHVILHTFTLPYTLTYEPFEYFRKILRAHMLTLMYGLRHPSDLKFVNLANFRLGVHHEPGSVIFSLSLDTCGSTFRITVLNDKKEQVNIAVMSALWQLEVLKAFSAKLVVDKITHAAKSDKSVDVTLTERFLTVLGSIQIISDGIGPPTNVS